MSRARCMAAAGAGWRRGRGCRWSRRSSCAWSCWQLGTDHFISCHHGKTLRRQVTGKNVIFITLKNIYIKISTGYWQMLNGYLCFTSITWTWCKISVTGKFEFRQSLERTRVDNEWSLLPTIYSWHSAATTQSTSQQCQWLWRSGDVSWLLTCHISSQYLLIST